MPRFCKTVSPAGDRSDASCSYLESMRLENVSSSFFLLVLLLLCPTGTLQEQQYIVTSDLDFITYLQNPLVTIIHIQNDFALNPTIWNEYLPEPASVDRNLTILGTLDYPILNLMFVPSKVQLAPGVALTLQWLVLERQRSVVRDTGLDIIVNSTGASVLYYESVWLQYACMPLISALPSFVKSPRPAIFPGVQKVDIMPDNYCITPDLCFPYALALDNFASSSHGTNEDPSHSYFTLTLNGSAVCLQQINPNSTTCQQLGVLSCLEAAVQAGIEEQNEAAAKTGGMSKADDIIIGVTVGVGGTLLILVALFAWQYNRERRFDSLSSREEGPGPGWLHRLFSWQKGPASISSSVVPFPEMVAGFKDAERSTDLPRAIAGSSTSEVVILMPASPQAKSGNLQIEGKDLRVDQSAGGILGTGISSFVYRGLLGEQEVAVKVLDSSSADAAERELFKHEVNILALCDHINIIKILGVCDTPNQLFIVEELALCSLDDLLYGKEDDSTSHNRLPLIKVLQIGQDVARALEYLHPTVIHRDLKPANVLLSADGRVKVSDFGLARLTETGTLVTMNAEVGSVKYMAPELFNPERESHNWRCDIYSFGILLWEMLSGLKPWRDFTMINVLTMVMQGRRPPIEAIQGCPPRLLRLVSRCWDMDPQKRPGAAEVAKELQIVEMEMNNPRMSRNA